MPGAQFGEGLFGVGDDRGLRAGEPERRVLGVIAERLDLPAQGKHVGRETDREIIGRIELSRLGVRLRLVEDGEEGPRASARTPARWIDRATGTWGFISSEIQGEPASTPMHARNP